MRSGFVRHWMVDLLALAVLCGYGALVWLVAGGTQGTASVALDPVMAAARERGTLRIAVDIGVLPFADQQGERLVGYDIELVEIVAARMGLAAEFVPTGFDGLYDALTSGRADLIASALVYAPEQGFRARFSTFYFDAGQMLLVPEAAPVSKRRDLAGRTVGVALGSDADALARRLVRDGLPMHLVSAYDEPADAVAALQAGHLDAVMVDHMTALAAIHAYPDLRLAEALSFEPLVLAMPRSAFQLEADINRILADLRREGVLTTLEQRWFGSARP
ncbi:ABC transporter substrate-binding protein [Candidatus Chloroploca sp. Khr17]|uniref:ABC transporter substrate-binding protein n=1 Tax=Candidatus Chloroploca sp. Khr17 TaxID=2496869 RepID=UPI00101C8E35|nr:ABC transporter substrate-binding protein [Candidatus Chloroploca sp. Khr17]